MVHNQSHVEWFDGLSEALGLFSRIDGCLQWYVLFNIRNPSAFIYCLFTYAVIFQPCRAPGYSSRWGLGNHNSQSLNHPGTDILAKHSFQSLDFVGTAAIDPSNLIKKSL
jgi:hypothetical protein